MSSEFSPPEGRTPLRRRRRHTGRVLEPRWGPPRPTAPGRQRYALVVLHGVDREGTGPNGSAPDGAGLDLELFRRLRALLRAKVSTTRNLTELDLWLDVPGGDPAAAYKIALLLRSYAAVLRVVVPDRVKGAATLLALAADELFMAPAAELGPVDVPMDCEPGGLRVTALELVRSADHVARSARDFTLSTAAAMSGTQGLSRRDCLDVAVRLSVELHQPLVAAIHPARLLEARQLMEGAVRYGDVLLSMRNPELVGTGGDALAAESLFDDLPGSGFVIDIDEARERGLPVQPLWQYPEAEAVQALHEYVEEQGGSTVDIREAGIDLRSVHAAAERADRDADREIDLHAELDAERDAKRDAKRDAERQPAGQ